MVTSIDGKVTGEFLYRPECEVASEIYYDINRKYKQNGASGFICGRVTMQQSFTGDWYPDLSKYEPIKPELKLADFWLDDEHMSGFYAIAFDPKGKLGWKTPFIEDSDPGYDKAQIIEVLTEQADARYLAYLRGKKIPYFFAGKDSIDVMVALKILQERTKADTLILEGGSIINGSFLCAECVDELSLVQTPITAGANSNPLFMNGSINKFELTSLKNVNGVLVAKYKSVT